MSPDILKVGDQEERSKCFSELPMPCSVSVTAQPTPLV